MEFIQILIKITHLAKIEKILKTIKISKKNNFLKIMIKKLILELLLFMHIKILLNNSKKKIKLTRMKISHLILAA